MTSVSRLARLCSALRQSRFHGSAHRRKLAYDHLPRLRLLKLTDTHRVFGTGDAFEVPGDTGPAVIGSRRHLRQADVAVRRERSRRCWNKHPQLLVFSSASPGQ